MKRCVFVMMAILLSTVVSAVEYEVVVVDKGEALVVANVEGGGSHRLPLPEDVVDVRVEGALYLVKDNSLELEIGSTDKALVVYKTSYLTAKQQDRWNFVMNLPEGSDAIINLPKNTVIHSTQPEALVQDAKYKTISWKDQGNKINIVYSFVEDGSLPITGNVVKEPTRTAPTYVWVLVLGVGAILLFAASKVIAKRKPAAMSKRSEKESVLKTLSENEMSVVSLLMTNGGEMKRNILEKESNIAKSSLASTLYNLERKKIVKVNKTYAVHFVQLTEWFLEL